MTTTKQKKNSKIRHLEYYDLQNTLDTLYADSGRGKISIISCHSLRAKKTFALLIET